MRAARPNAGFSLVEVMVAIVILGVGLVGLTEAVSTAVRSAKESELQTMAVVTAAGKMEELRAEGYVTEGETDGDCAGGLADYRWRQTVARGDQDGLFDVTVVIENTTSGKQVYELRTLLFDPPTSTASRSGQGGAGAETKRDRETKSRGREGRRS